MENFNALQEKFGFSYIDGKRCYKIDFSARNYDLEYTSPMIFKINNNIIEEKHWTNLLTRVTKFLIVKYPQANRDLLNYNVEWSKQRVFTPVQTSPTDYGPLLNGLYLNTNQTSLHLCWLLQDILVFFGVQLEDCELWIRRSPGQENKEIIGYFQKKSQEKFCWFMEKRLNLEKNTISNVIAAIEKIDILFSKFFPNRLSILLFETTVEFSTYRSKFLNRINTEIENEKYLKTIKYIVNLISKYYSFLNQNSMLENMN